MARLAKAETGAEILDVTIARFYELVRTRVLPAGVVVHLGRQIRVDEDALREWIRAGGQALAGGWRREPERDLIPTQHRRDVGGEDSIRAPTPRRRSPQ